MQERYLAADKDEWTKKMILSVIERLLIVVNVTLYEPAPNGKR